MVLRIVTSPWQASNVTTCKTSGASICDCKATLSLFDELKARREYAEISFQCAFLSNVLLGFVEVFPNAFKE